MQSFSVKAPVRVDLAGGTLDLWPIYCLLGGGKTINAAVDLFAEAHFEVADHDRFECEVKAGDSEPVNISGRLTVEDARKLPGLAQFPAALVGQYLSTKSTLPNKFIKLATTTKAPPKSGLGGSSSLAVAIGTGLARIFGDYTHQGWQWDFLNWVRDAEASFLRTPTGTQDYLAALWGGLRTYHYGSGSLSQTGFSDDVTKGFSERALILYSGEMHESGLSNWEIFRGAFENDADILQGFESIRSVSDELFTELSAKKVDWTKVGALLSREWDERRKTFQVNTPRLDEIVTHLKGQPILGVKVCGAAQGGSLLVLVDPSKKEAVAKYCLDQGIEVLNAQANAPSVLVSNAPIRT